MLNLLIQKTIAKKERRVLNATKKDYVKTGLLISNYASEYSFSCEYCCSRMQLQRRSLPGFIFMSASSRVHERWFYQEVMQRFFAAHHPQTLEQFHEKKSEVFAGF